MLNHNINSSSGNGYNYRTIIKKAASPNSSRAMSELSNSAKPVKKRTNSFGSSVSIGKTVSDNSLLDSTKINYPIHEIPDDLLRFIPDSQLELIKPLINQQQAGLVSGESFIQRKKYSTNVDERSYLTVFEYQLDDNWIIWDYSTGYVFFTGLWKSCGHNKTDIVKLVDNFPNVISTESVKRVRGGFLKIQGTWLPYEIVKKLAKNFCFNIRYCLVPLFGSEFPNQCLKPNDKNFGKLVDVDAPEVPIKSRRRSSNSTTSTSHPFKPQNTFMKRVRSKSDSQQIKPKSLSKVSSRFNSIPIIEMEEILKASKQLHDLSFSHISPIHNTQIQPPVQPRRYSFNYGGFIWSWHDDDNNLKILGKDDEDAIVIDEKSSPLTSPSTSNPILFKNDTSHPTSYYDHFDTQNGTGFPSSVKTGPNTSPHRSLIDRTSPYNFSPSSNQIVSAQNGYGNTGYAVPKKFDGFETLLTAANELIENPNVSGDGQYGVKRSLEHYNPQFGGGIINETSVLESSPGKNKKMEIDGLLS